MPAFIFVLFIGLFIRILLIGNPGFVADIAFWKSWSLAAVDHGIVWTAHNTNINYPPGFIYVLWLMGKIYSLLGNAHDYNNYWRENNFWFLFASKSIAITSDIIITCLIYWFFSKKEKSNLPLLLSSVFFLNPVVILDSALWGQVESFGILFTLVAIILLFYRHPLPAAAVFTVGILMKLQNIIYIPLFFLFILRYFNFKTLAKSLGVAALTFTVVTFPFILANDLKQVLYLMTINVDFFPWLSLNAFNLWWIVAGAAGMQITDKITVLGILNAKTVGLLIFISFYFLSTVLLLLKPTARNFLLSLTIAIFAFFLFTTQSHERYSYPVIVSLLILYPFLEGRTTKLILFFWTVYALLTLTIFFNFHTGLIFNYPNNGFFTLSRLTTPVATIVDSYLLIILFLLLLPFVFSQISYYFIVLTLAIFTGGIVLFHFPYYVEGRVPLTFFKPVIQKQDYAGPQINRSVDSFSGWKSWTRLSNNYFYYRQGIGSHANSTLVFDINKKFKQFSTDFGVDTEASTLASVTFKIKGDDKELFASDKMGRFDFPQHAEVDISGVKRLELVITDAEDGANSDHADWLNPILYK